MIVVKVVKVSPFDPSNVRYEKYQLVDILGSSKPFLVWYLITVNGLASSDFSTPYFRKTRLQPDHLEHLVSIFP